MRINRFLKTLMVLAGLLVVLYIAASEISSIRPGRDFKVTGVCKKEGEERRPAFASDFIKVSSVSEKIVRGVVLMTREDVECDLDLVSFDRVLFLSNVEIPAISAPVKKAQICEPPQGLLNSQIRITGPCVSESGEKETLVDELVGVISVKPENECDSFELSAISTERKKMYKCSTSSLNYQKHIVDDSKMSSDGIAQVNAERRVSSASDLIGKTILVTGECFPDVSGGTVSGRQISYPADNAQIRVIRATMEGGSLKVVRGFMTNKKANVVCDQERFPFIWREFDANQMRLIDVSVDKDKKENSK